MVGHLAIVQSAFRKKKNSGNRDKLPEQAAACAVKMEVVPLPAVCSHLLSKYQAASKVIADHLTETSDANSATRASTRARSITGS